MTRRIVTSAVGLPLIVAVVYFGGIYLRLTLLVLSCVGLAEFYQAMTGELAPAVKNKRALKDSLPIRWFFGRFSIHDIGYAFTVLYYFLLPDIASAPYFFVMITMFIITLLVFIVLFYEKIHIIDCALTLFGFFYVAFLLSFIYLVRMHLLGIFFVWLIFISAFGCDTSAYFTGRMLGRHKLTPKLSPNKTVEGAVGGVIGAGLLALLYGFFIVKVLRIASNLTSANIILYSAAVGLVGAVFASFGDLAASSIKRLKNIKDFGALFPGHGGVLDRFDSVIFAAPMVYMVMILLLKR
ncbi:MAG: phosphatidate cytidylyltransferase [Clostridiales bacterium]|jgi:phosphatidate cytidylyltransferase|nr:phosphatidate cytidylyltransferase [Clostridiales bacterium]